MVGLLNSTAATQLYYVLPECHATGMYFPCYYIFSIILIDKVRLFSSDQTQVSLHCIASRTSMVTVSYHTPQRYEIIVKFMDTQHILIKILFNRTKFILFQINLQKFKEYVLYEMLDLSGNTGQLPSVFCHILEWVHKSLF
jgi:hypothetical protein